MSTSSRSSCAWAFAYIQKDGDGAPDERNWLRDETGGSVYLRLSTRPVEQIKRAMTPDLRQQIVDGAYWLREPGPNAQVVVAYTGAIAPEAIEAVGLMAEDRRDVGLLAVTSADRLNAGWTAAQRARERGLVHARSHIERLFADVPPHCGIVTVLDGHPATLAWLGAVAGHRTRSLGVEHFGQTGSLAELYRHYGIDANAIVAAAQAIAPGPADPASEGAAVDHRPCPGTRASAEPSRQGTHSAALPSRDARLRAPRHDRSMLRILQHHRRALLGDHHGRRIGVAGGDRRHHRGVDDAQAARGRSRAAARRPRRAASSARPMRAVPTGWKIVVPMSPAAFSSAASSSSRTCAPGRYSTGA